MSIRYFRVDHTDTWIFEVRGTVKDPRSIYVIEGETHSSLVVGPDPSADPVYTVKYFCDLSECEATARSTFRFAAAAEEDAAAAGDAAERSPPIPTIGLHKSSPRQTNPKQTNPCKKMARSLVRPRDNHHPEKNRATESKPLVLADGTEFIPNPYNRRFQFLFALKQTFDIALCADKDVDILAFKDVLEREAANMETSSYIGVAKQWDNFATQNKENKPLSNFATFAASAFLSEEIRRENRRENSRDSGELLWRDRKEKAMKWGFQTFSRICGSSISFNDTLMYLDKSPALLRIPFFMGMQKLGEYTSSDNWIDDRRIEELDKPDGILWVCDMLVSIVGRLGLDSEGGTAFKLLRLEGLKRAPIPCQQDIRALREIIKKAHEESKEEHRLLDVAWEYMVGLERASERRSLWGV